VVQAKPVLALIGRVFAEVYQQLDTTFDARKDPMFSGPSPKRGVSVD
jgi:hypothetical protein